MNRNLVMGLGAGLASALIGAGWQLATRHSTTTTIAPIDLTLLRYGIPALLLFPFLRGVGLFPKSVSARHLALMVFGAGLPFGLMAMSGSRYAPVAHMAVFMAGAAPLFTAAIEWLVTRERLSRARLAGLACMAVGVGMLGYKAFGARLGEAWIGDLLFLAAAAMWVGFTLSFRRSGLSAWQAAALVNGWSALLLIPLFLVAGVPKLLNAPAGDILFQTLWQGVLAGVLGLGAFSLAVSRLGATGAASFGALVPALAGLGGWWFLREPLAAMDIAAIVLVAAGVAIASGLLGSLRLQCGMTTQTPPPGSDENRAHEQDALRKARALVEEVQEQDRKRHAMQKQVLMAGAIVCAGVLGFVTWQKQRDLGAEARDACEYAAFQKRVAEVKSAIQREKPTLNQREVQAEADKQMAQLVPQIKRECAAVQAK
jgi:drug/metabolite transporter (DMT)-like permease